MTLSDIPKSVSHYRILNLLGCGGMGEVYLAEDVQLNRTVALKMLPASLAGNPVRLGRFLNEAKIAASLVHPNAAVIYEAGEAEDGRPFIAMEYVEGCTLGARLDSGPFPPLELMKIATQVAGVLDEAHSRGIIHRDIKPGNIMVTPRRGAKVLDFGLAKVKEAVPGTPLGRLSPHPPTDTGTAPGTLPYMSPEQLLGRDLDHRTDIFSFGSVLYEMATARRPFDGETAAAVAESIIHSTPPPPSSLNPSVSPELEGVILKALEKDRERRYQSASDMELVLTELVRTSDSKTRTVPNGLGDEKKRRRLVPYALVALALCAVALLALEIARPGTLRGLLGIPPSGGRHLVVLPIRNPGKDPAAQVLCDGLVDYITARLTMLQQFRGSPTVEPFTVAQYPEVQTIQDARKTFGATLVLEGSLERQGSRARLILNLIDPRTLRVLKSTVIDDEASNAFAFQDVALIKIASMLGLRTESRVISTLAAGGTTNAGAYGAYLNGLGLLYRGGPRGADKALPWLEEAVRQDPEYVSAYASLAGALLLKYRLDRDPALLEQAASASESALTLGPDMAPVRIVRAEVELAHGRAEEARADVEHALKTDPQSHEAYEVLADVYVALKRPDKAEATYRQAISLNAGSPWGYNVLGAFYLDQARYEEALEQYLKVVELVPESYVGYLNLGAVYLMLDRTDEARQMLERSVKVLPSYRGYMNLGTVALTAEQYEKAAAYYEEALKLNDADYSTWGNLGIAYHYARTKTDRAGEAFQQAATRASEALRINPKDYVAMADLASYYALLGERSKVPPLLDQALPMAGSNPDVLALAGEIYEELGDRDRALEWIRKACELGYTDTFLARDPDLQQLRADPRYTEATAGCRK